jgi:hypothetical protein
MIVQCYVFAFLQCNINSSAFPQQRAGNSFWVILGTDIKSNNFALSVIRSYIPIRHTWYHKNFPYDHCVFLIPATKRGWGSPSFNKFGNLLIPPLTQRPRRFPVHHFQPPPPCHGHHCLHFVAIAVAVTELKLPIIPLYHLYRLCISPHTTSASCGGMQLIPIVGFFHTGPFEIVIRGGMVHCKEPNLFILLVFGVIATWRHKIMKPHDK